MLLFAASARYVCCKMRAGARSATHGAAAVEPHDSPPECTHTAVPLSQYCYKAVPLWIFLFFLRRTSGDAAQSMPSPLVRRRGGCAAIASGCCHPGRNIGHLLLACAVLCRFEGGSSEGGGRGGVWRAGGEAEARGHRLPTKLATMGMGDSNAPGDHGKRDPDHRADMRFVSAGLETHQVRRFLVRDETFIVVKNVTQNLE